MELTANRGKWWVIGVALVVLGLTKVALIKWYWDHKKQAEDIPIRVSCNMASLRCALPGSGELVFVSPPVSGKPFHLRLNGVEGNMPSAEFSMVAMDMGINRYHFIADGGGWKADVTLPVCMTGDKDWVMKLSAAGRTYLIPFKTQ